MTIRLDSENRDSSAAPMTSGVAMAATVRLRRRRFAAALALSALAGGCGFKLRGSQRFAFSEMALQPSPGGPVVQELRAALSGSVRILGAEVPSDKAPLRLEILSEQREKTVVGVNTSGQVREFQLRLRVSFKLDVSQGRELIAPETIVQLRDISYNETYALAKETEQAQLYRDMQSDVVQQILRRLAAIKLPP